MVSTIKVLLEERKVLETVIVKGEAERMKELTETIMSMKGVRHVKLTTTYGGI